MTQEEYNTIKQQFVTALSAFRKICDNMQKPEGKCPGICPLSYAGGCLRRTTMETAKRFLSQDWGVKDTGDTCRNCRRGRTEEKTQAVFCTIFDAFTIRPCEHFLSVFEEPEEPPVAKDSDTPAHPTANGMTCRDCAMCEELEPDTWYCAQYGSLMDEDNMEPCMHFIFDSELKKEMFQDGNPEQET